ncbi:MAG: exodeoxyribonuclease VII large subunit [Prevotella sp.]|nr:exodeoxyribonuclease VII large subunit [Prevotella sp.]MBR6591217.1 exodeoxyribonuclease VII large subunit [Prevotella sp.]
MIQQDKAMTLLELNGMVRTTLERGMRDEYWVETELAEARETRGHCYMELVQKDSLSNTPVAKASAKCWKQTWMLMQPYFERSTGQPLRAGMKVLLRVYPNFHEAYGFSWIVTDIDPTFTVGDLARRRQEIIAALKAQGIFDMNRQLELPMFAQRIAVISSQTAAGYGDFCNQLNDNPYGFRFQTTLFPAVMQGEGVEQSVIAALERIYEEVDNYDCVVIIRGGGATSDMSGFDTLALAENVAQFPLPVITGIGHDRDESVLDMVACIRVKTPTAAAAYLVSHLLKVSDLIDNMNERMVRCATMRIEMQKMRLARLSERLPSVFSLVKVKREAHLDALNSRLITSVRQFFDRQTHRLDMLGQRAAALDPKLLLSRGYSITIHNGKAVRDKDTLKPGDEIETIFEKGTVKSIVK